MADNIKEVWLRGETVRGIVDLLQPIAHALLQANEEVEVLMTDFPNDQLWEKPAALASVGFHLQHLKGVLNRLFTYAKGQALSEEQLAYLKKEGESNSSISTSNLVVLFSLEIENALQQLKEFPAEILTERRTVGRGKLPSTVIGLLTHAAEHTMRHVGQLLVTVKVVTQLQISKTEPSHH